LGTVHFVTTWALARFWAGLASVRAARARVRKAAANIEGRGGGGEKKNVGWNADETVNQINEKIVGGCVI
jgi:hypothetical protein